MTYLKDKDKIFSNHATKRCQQRGIPKEVAIFIFNHGKSLNTHGQRKYFINKKRLRQLQQDNRTFCSKHDKHLLSTAVVCSNEIIVTAMKINKRLTWH